MDKMWTTHYSPNCDWFRHDWQGKHLRDATSIFNKIMCIMKNICIIHDKYLMVNIHDTFKVLSVSEVYIFQKVLISSLPILRHIVKFLPYIMNTLLCSLFNLFPNFNFGWIVTLYPKSREIARIYIPLIGIGPTYGIPILFFFLSIIRTVHVAWMKIIFTSLWIKSL